MGEDQGDTRTQYYKGENRLEEETEDKPPKAFIAFGLGFLANGNLLSCFAQRSLRLRAVL